MMVVKWIVAGGLAYAILIAVMARLFLWAARHPMEENNK